MENPRAWKLKCETYFRVSGVHFEHWVGVAALQFVGGGGGFDLVQSSDAHVVCVCWNDFAEAVCRKFGREEFQGLIRQFNRLRQTGSVASYAEKFSELIHQLHAHHSSWNPVFFITQFMDGLRPEIRTAVVLHRPQDLNTAVDLACLQEDVLENVRRDNRRGDFAVPVHPAVKFGNSISTLPVRAQAGMGTRAEDRRPVEATGLGKTDDKLSALRAYRRAKGLCYTCGERWSREHKCGPTVQLHVVEELWEMLSAQSVDDSPETVECMQESEEEVTDSEVCQISREAVLGIEASGTLRLQGLIQKHAVLMLVDYGSSHSFVSEELANKLHGSRANLSPIRVRVADGGVLNCSQEIQNCEWLVQGHTFCSHLKILPLGSYDVILGMDWLSRHSPMQIDWRGKTISFQLG